MLQYLQKKKLKEDLHTDDIRKDLTLMLLYLNSWEEGEPGYKYRRSWKGYDFDDLNALAEDELIVDGRRAKSVSLTADGEEKVQALLRKYGIATD